MVFLSPIKKWLEKPVRFEYIGAYLTPGTKILDVGCGAKAPYSTFTYYPNLIYSGIDWDDISGRDAMEYFFKCDLEDSDLTQIPDRYYDIISMSHIIEHISNGEKLVSTLLSKLKSGGILYIETPSEKSLRLPSWYGTLNFYDDPTHKKVYSIKELEMILKKNGCQILRAGIRRSLKRIVLSPLYIVLSLLRDGKINASSIWDIVGFAHYVIAKKQ